MTFRPLTEAKDPATAPTVPGPCSSHSPSKEKQMNDIMNTMPGARAAMENATLPHAAASVANAMARAVAGSAPNASAAAEGMLKPIPETIRAKYKGNHAIDELDFATDLLRMVGLALTNTSTGAIDSQDITSAGYVVSYALDALRMVRPVLDEMEG